LGQGHTSLSLSKEFGINRGVNMIDPQDKIGSTTNKTLIDREETTGVANVVLA
jgi:hypothetical protein